MRFIPLDDPKRNRRGNRTVRVSLSTWTDLQKQKCWPDAKTVLRDVCRIGALHLPVDDPRRGAELLSSYGKSVELLQSLLHGSHWRASPSAQRKKYAPLVRSLLVNQRAHRERICGFIKPGQSSCRIP